MLLERINRVIEIESQKDRPDYDLIDACRRCIAAERAEGERLLTNSGAMVALAEIRAGISTDHNAAPTVQRVSFRKNVEIAPFKHEHAEVTVECNGASLAEAAKVAKDAVDEVLGVKELRTAQEQIENAKRVLRDAAKARAKRGRQVVDRALDDAASWGDDD